MSEQLDGNVNNARTCDIPDCLGSGGGRIIGRIAVGSIGLVSTDVVIGAADIRIGTTAALSEGHVVSGYKGC